MNLFCECTLIFIKRMLRDKSGILITAELFSVTFLCGFASEPVKSYMCLPQVANRIVFVNIWTCIERIAYCQVHTNVN